MVMLSVGGSIDPSKDTIVNGCLGGDNFDIDIDGVERRLIVHALRFELAIVFEKSETAAAVVAQAVDTTGPRARS
jgi:hypothetical protein